MIVPRLRLRTLVLSTFGLLGALAVAAAGAILTLASYQRETASYLVLSVRSVLVAGQIEADLHRLAPAGAPVDGAEEASLQRHLADSRRLIQSADEGTVVERLESAAAAVLRARRERAAGRASDEEVLFWIQAALPRCEALLDVNLAQAGEAERRAVERARRSSLWAAAAAAAVVAAMLALLFWARLRLVRPLERLRLSIQRMAQGGRGERAPEEMPPELREVAVTLNAMARLVEEQQQGRIEFLGRVGESLASPLQRLRDTLDRLVLRSPPLGEAEGGALSALLVQARELERMVGEFLDAARLEEGQLPLQPEQFDLREPAREAVELFRGLLPDHRFELRLPPGPVLVRADAQRMAQVLNNLIAVALRRSPSGARLDFELSAAQGQAILRARVEEGPALGFADLFNLLHGLDDRLRGVPGAVFGLHASRKLIDAQGGRLEVGPGSGVEVRLPLADRPAQPAGAAVLPHPSLAARPR